MEHTPVLSTFSYRCDKKTFNSLKRIKKLSSLLHFYVIYTVVPKNLPVYFLVSTFGKNSMTLTTESLLWEHRHQCSQQKRPRAETWWSRQNEVSTLLQSQLTTLKQQYNLLTSICYQ